MLRPFLHAHSSPLKTATPSRCCKVFWVDEDAGCGLRRRATPFSIPINGQSGGDIRVHVKYPILRRDTPSFVFLQPEWRRGVAGAQRQSRDDKMFFSRVHLCLTRTDYQARHGGELRQENTATCR